MKSLPRPVQEALQQHRTLTATTPQLALNQAVALDRHLEGLGWTAPLTYSARGEAVDGVFTTPQPAAITEQSALFDAVRIAREGQAAQGVALAWQQAHGEEIAALNLLYANEALAVDTLWLKFFNKYLAHRTAALGAPAERYQLRLRRGPGTRFDRFEPATQLTAITPRREGPRVSVLMPVFNAQATLETAARSILAQTWTPLELLLIDDCSTDGSLAIAHRLAAQDSRVRVLALRENGGPYMAKNHALAHARGDYLTVHDADDWAFPTRLEDQLQPLLVPGRGALRVTAGRALRMTPQGQMTRFDAVGWLTPDGAMRLCFPSPLFERRYFDEKLGGWHPVRVGADAEILQRVTRFEPEALVQLDQPVMLQLDLEGSLTRAAQTHNDERGEAAVRTAYRVAWNRWHAEHRSMPKNGFVMPV